MKLGRSAAQGDDVQRRKRRRVGPARRGDRFERHRVVHDRRRHLRRRRRDPPRYGNSVVGVHMVGDELKLKDYFTPTNWEWLRKRDLDPNNTPTDLHLQGARADRRVRQGVPHVPARSASRPAAPTHQTPLYKTPLFCNEEVDFQDAGSWGALSTWEDPGGTRWILAPFWGPVHSQFKFEVTHGPVTGGGVWRLQAATIATASLSSTPVWVSRDMKRGEPVVDRQRHGLRLRQRRGNQAVVPGHRAAVRLVDPRAPSRTHATHLRARRADRRRAVVERRSDARRSITSPGSTVATGACCIIGTLTTARCTLLRLKRRRRPRARSRRRRNKLQAARAFAV